MNRGILLLSLGFFVIFFGYVFVHQYTTVYFQQLGLVDLGFQSLIIIYLFFTISSLFSAFFISKFGAKNAMMIGASFYFLYIFSLLTKIPELILAVSALNGIAASLLWAGQNVYLIKASSEKFYGANAGFFGASFSIGSGLGLLTIGFILSYLTFNTVFLIASIFPIIGIAIFTQLKDLRTKIKTDGVKQLKRSIKSVTALRLSTIWFCFYFISGFTLGLIPLHIKETLGVAFVGILMSIFWVAPGLLSYIIGKISDKVGRKRIILISYIILLLSFSILYFSVSTLLLIISIVLLSIHNSIKSLVFAIVGDVSTRENLESLTALFITIQNIGLTSALILSIFIKTKEVYLISIGIVLASLIILIPLLKYDFKIVRLRLSEEV